MAHARELPPIRKAFRLWIGAIGRWWPLASHSVTQADALDCTIEARTGGRDLRDHAGARGARLGQVAVATFPIEEGRTGVELTHRGWAVHAGARRADYDQGWQALLRDDDADRPRRLVCLS